MRSKSYTTLLCGLTSAVLLSAFGPSAAQEWVEEEEEEVFLLYTKEGAFSTRPPENEEQTRAGHKLYEQKCVWCHGLTGKGDGPVALGMGERGNPKPTDLTNGKYKVRTTPSGQLPTDEDIFAILTRGMPGTSMLAWSGLSEQQRWQLVYYLKSLSPHLQGSEREPITIGQAVPRSYESLAKGRWLYMDSGCAKCHGSSGRGDGYSAPIIKDSRGLPLQVTDLTSGDNYRGGHSTRDIYRTLVTGFGGSAMPSYEGALTEEQLWHLANYVRALSVNDGELFNLRHMWIDVSEPDVLY